MLSKIKFLSNFYVASTLLFVVWLTFFDNNDIISQLKLKTKILELQEQKNYYADMIEKIQDDIFDLRTNEETLEKFAREKYLMKKPNEDVFVIIEED